VSYSLYILPRVEKEIAALDSRHYESVKKKIDTLREEPRPPGCRKLANSQDWRIRTGNYRIVYQIDDAARTVTVLRVGHRREIYR
jgi:mRNA interferase RelE/StbE